MSCTSNSGSWLWEEEHRWGQSVAEDRERQLRFSESFVLAGLCWTRMPEFYCFYMPFISPQRYLFRSSPQDWMLGSLIKQGTAGCCCGHGTAFKEVRPQERIRTRVQKHSAKTAIGAGAGCMLQSMCWWNTEKLGETGNRTSKDYL